MGPRAGLGFTAAYPTVRVKMTELAPAQLAVSTLLLAWGHSSPDVSFDGNSSKEVQHFEVLVQGTSLYPGLHIEKSVFGDGYRCIPFPSHRRLKRNQKSKRNTLDDR